MDKNNWKKLLTSLSSEKNNDGEYRIYYESELKESGSDEEIINTKADLSYNEKATSDNPGADYYRNIQKELFTTLENNNASLNDIKDNLSKIWPAIIWNDSMAKLIADFWYYYKKSENDFIVEKEDGTIDSYFTNGTIAAAGAEASFRKRDIRDADAGYFFGREDATYEECYSLKGQGYFKLDTMYYYFDNVLFKSSVNSFFEKALKGEQSSVSFTYYVGKFYHTLIAPKDLADNSPYKNYKEKKLSEVLEKERIVLNPWVVLWYNFDADTYSKVRGTDKHYSTLANKDYLQMTREQELKDERGTIRKKDNRKITIKNEKGKDETIDMNTNTSDSSYEWLRLLMPQYKRRVEVEDINRNFWVIGQVVGAISAYLFDDESPISKLIQGILNEILQLWENVLLLWVAIGTQKTRNYNKTHCEVVYLTNSEIQPFLKYDGFEELLEVINGEDKWTLICDCINERIEYLKYQYSDYNLIIVPCIRLDNYEHNYYSQDWLPGAWVLNRNMLSNMREKNSIPESLIKNKYWKIYEFPKYSKNAILGIEKGIVLNAADYVDKIYGIREEEEIYSWIAPLKHVEDFALSDPQRYYGLLREKIKVEGEVNSTSNELISILNNLSIKIELTDVGEELIKKTSDFEIKFDFNYDKDENSFPSSIEPTTSEPLSSDQGSAKITKGYYQGELLSKYGDIPRIVYTLYNLKTVNLAPSIKSKDEYKAWYISNELSAKERRSKDEEVLIKVINNFYEYNTYENKEDFWTKERESLFGTGTHYYDFTANNMKSATRKDAPENFIDSTKYFTNENTWKEKNANFFKTDTEINRGTILFVEGETATDYSATTDTNRKGSQIYFPYRADGTSQETDGLLASYLNNDSYSSSLSGAVISLPTNTKERATSFFTQHQSVSTDASSTTAGWHTLTESSDHTGYVRNDDTVILKEDLGDAVIDSLKFSYWKDGGGSEQWLVMIKKGDSEITFDNWLVVKLHTPSSGIEYNLDNGINLYKSSWGTINRSADEFYTQIAREVAKDIYENNLSQNNTAKSIGTDIKDWFKKNNSKIQDWDYTKKTDEWYQTQALLYDKLDEWYTGQNALHTKENSTWNEIATTLLAKYNREEPKYRTLNADLPSNKKITINNRIYIQGTIFNSVNVYVFGPNGKYARRANYRSADANPKYSFSVADEPFEDGTVDQLREGYIVISNDHPSENREKYKSYLYKSNNQMYPGYGYDNNPWDDPRFKNYSIEWQEDWMDWDK